MFCIGPTAEYDINEHFILMHSQRLGPNFCYKYCRTEFFKQFWCRLIELFIIGKF